MAVGAAVQEPGQVGWGWAVVLDSCLDTGRVNGRVNDPKSSHSNLRLLRTAVVAVGRPPLDLESLHFSHADAFVEVGRRVQVDGNPAGNIVLAVVPGVTVELVDDQFTVPADACRDAETMIETIARLLALRHRTSYSISSPMPFVGFASDDSHEVLALEGKRFAGSVMSGIGPFADDGPDIGEGRILAGLQDRLDGVALLTETLRQDNALGKYRDLIRLFERAFAVGVGSLTQHLVPFLTDPACPHGFTKREVHRWVDARAKASHADRRPDFLLEADARPWVERMTEAGYDVLLNKAEWQMPTAARRDLWKPTSGSLNAEAGLFMTKGHGGTIRYQFLDGFEAYPLMLAGPVDALLPDGVWLEGGEDGGELRRIDTTTRAGIPGLTTAPPACQRGSHEPSVPFDSQELALGQGGGRTADRGWW